MSKILLAEDDIDMRRFLVKALQNAGFDVISYDNGLSAYQRLREEPFELLLTDIVMPEMDGIELARRAAELDPDIKIMFITGFARGRAQFRSRTRPSTPRCCRSRSICASSSTKCKSCSRPDSATSTFQYPLDPSPYFAALIAAPRCYARQIAALVIEDAMKLVAYVIDGHQPQHLAGTA